MALRDLVAQKAKFTEEAIEAIISDYVRYDIDELDVVFTPNATELSSKAKVLVYLVALQGWEFVQEEAIDVEMTPAQLSERLGIAGGTLRPILKDLKDRNLLAGKSRKYSVRSTGLDAINAELEGQSRPGPPRRKSPSKGGTSQANRGRGSSEEKQSREKVAPTRRSRSSTSPGQKPGEAFNRFVDDGFFDEGRTLAQLLVRMHEQAIMVKQSSLPGYLLAAVRNSRLTREKQDVDGRSVWVYSSATHGKSTS